MFTSLWWCIDCFVCSVHVVGCFQKLPVLLLLLTSLLDCVPNWLCLLILVYPPKKYIPPNWSMPQNTPADCGYASPLYTRHPDNISLIQVEETHAPNVWRRYGPRTAIGIISTGPTGPNFIELLSTTICLAWNSFLDKNRISNQISSCWILLVTGI